MISRLISARSGPTYLMAWSIHKRVSNGGRYDNRLTSNGNDGSVNRLYFFFWIVLFGFDSMDNCRYSWSRNGRDGDSDNRWTNDKDLPEWRSASVLERSSIVVGMTVDKNAREHRLESLSLVDSSSLVDNERFITATRSTRNRWNDIQMKKTAVKPIS